MQSSPAEAPAAIDSATGSLGERDGALVVTQAHEAPGVRRLTVAPGRAWPFRPGQVAELSIGPGKEGYFAIASAPAEGSHLAFLIKAEGSDSEPLMHLQPGARLTLRGPFGAGFELPSGTRDLLFVAAGTAIAAVRSAIVQALSEDGASRLALVVGVRRPSELCCADEIVAWQERGVAVQVCVSGDAPLPTSTSLTFARGRVQSHLDEHARATTHAFIAGSEELEDEVTAKLVELGVSFERIQRNYRPDARVNR